MISKMGGITLNTQKLLQIMVQLNIERQIEIRHGKGHEIPGRMGNMRKDRMAEI